MREELLRSGSLWQAPLGWLGASLLVGYGLIFFYQQTSPSYRRTLRNIRWLLIPYIGLLTGGISPRLMGLIGINLFASFGFGLVLIGSILALLIVIRSVTDFSLSTLPTPQLNLLLRSESLPIRYASSLPDSVLDIGAEEFHWAFLRSALWESFLLVPLLATQAGYWAAWVTVLLALPEIFRYHQTFTQRLCKGALLVTTTVLFLFTRNLWLTWLLHTLGWTLLSPSVADHEQSASAT
ncbi:MAG: hypothetical protein R3E79_33460 [Caldilineaceae bacterium]